MSWKTFGVFSVGAASLLIGTLAVAQGPGGRGDHGPGGPGGPLRALIHDLDLTVEQEAMLADFRAEAKASRPEGKRGGVLRAQIESGRLDAEDLHAEVDTRLADMSLRMHSQVDNLVAFWATLSPEQIATVQQRAAEGPPEGRGRGRGRGPAPE